MARKLIVETVSGHGHGDSQEYLCLAYENSWGVGLARNQLQFIADQINSGKIMLPDAAKQERKPTFEERIKDAKTMEEIAEAFIGRSMADAMRNILLSRRRIAGWRTHGRVFAMVFP